MKFNSLEFACLCYDYDDDYNIYEYLVYKLYDQDPKYIRLKVYYNNEMED